MPSLSRWAAGLCALQVVVDARYLVQTIDRRQLVDPIVSVSKVKSRVPQATDLSDGQAKSNEEMLIEAGLCIRKSPEQIEQAFQLVRADPNTAGNHGVQDAADRGEQSRLGDRRDNKSITEMSTTGSVSVVTVSVTSTSLTTYIVESIKTAVNTAHRVRGSSRPLVEGFSKALDVIMVTTTSVSFIPVATVTSRSTESAARAHVTIDGIVYDATTLPPGRYQNFSKIVLGAAAWHVPTTTHQAPAATTPAARGQASGANNHGPVLKVYSTRTLRIIKASGTRSSIATATVQPLRPGDSIAHKFRIKTKVFYGDIKFDNLTIQIPGDLSSPTVPQLGSDAQTAATFYLDPSTASVALSCSKSRANLGLVMIRDRDQDAYGSVILSREIGTARIGFERSNGVELAPDSLERILWDNDRFGSWLACQRPVSGRVELKWWDVVSNQGIDERACAKVELLGERIADGDVKGEC